MKSACFCLVRSIHEMQEQEKTLLYYVIPAQLKKTRVLNTDVALMATNQPSEYWWEDADPQKASGLYIYVQTLRLYLDVSGWALDFTRDLKAKTCKSKNNTPWILIINPEAQSAAELWRAEVWSPVVAECIWMWSRMVLINNMQCWLSKVYLERKTKCVTLCYFLCIHTGDTLFCVGEETMPHIPLNSFSFIFFRSVL